MGQGGFPVAGNSGKPEKSASVAVEAVAVGLLDAALEGEDSDTRLPCITNDGDMIIVPGARYDGMLPRPLKGIAGRSNENR